MQRFAYVRVPTLSSLYSEDGRLANVGADYSRIPRLRRHSWSPEEKQVLYVLNTYYQNPTSDLWRTFKAEFAGRRSMPRRTAWNTMRCYIANPSRYHVWWSSRDYQVLRARVESTALSIGIRLLPKANSAPTTPNSKRKRTLRSSVCSSSSDGEVGWDSSDSASPGESNVKRKFFKNSNTPQARRATVANGLLTPPSTAKKSTKRQTWGEADAVEQLVDDLQAFNHRSQGLNGINGFVAGSFINCVPQHDPPENSVYLKELWRHLEKHHSGPTPFISVSQHLMRVIIHAYRRDRDNHEKTAWNVAVINLSRVTSSVRPVWKLAAGRNARMAFGEWVVIVYGSIPAANVLCVVPLNRLAEVMSYTTPPFHVDELMIAERIQDARDAMKLSVKRRLTYNDGLAFGRLLLCLGVPRRYVDETTGLILKDWRYAEHEPGAWGSNEEFVRGRDEEFESVLEGFSELATESDGFRAVGKYESVLPDAGLSASYGCSGLDDMHYKHHADGATDQHPLNVIYPFANFLEELEEAASSAISVDGPLAGGSSNARLEDNPDLNIKEESSDCMVLDSVSQRAIKYGRFV
ncbi:MAG: hypothetical protein Q9209_006164 [Squamulea sp. 1 TL-2023]